MSTKQKIMGLWLILLNLNASLTGSAQKADYSRINARYNQAYDSLDLYLRNTSSFKDAVFVVENCFRRNTYDRKVYLKFINEYYKLCLGYWQNAIISNYTGTDKVNYSKNYTLFRLFCDTTIISQDLIRLVHFPFAYDFNDPFGKASMSNMFVTKLLATHKGNCHSLAYLYKILADELGAECWLALAPNHIYIRNYSEQSGWYNTELTSGVFPTDAWVAMTGYISTDAIRGGIYMDTLSKQQSMALCVIDLGKAYEFQTHNYYDGFIVKCCDLALKYHSVNPQALLLKAETLQKVYFKQHKEGKLDARYTYDEMEKTYITLAKLGYREMPEKMYRQWLQSLKTNKEKFTNRKVNVHIKEN